MTATEVTPLRVLALPRYDRLGPSSRLRFFDPLPWLAQAGLDVAVRPFFDDPYLERQFAGRRTDPLALARYYARRLRALRDRGAFDLLWIEKEALPWLPTGVEAALLAGTPYALDFDDAWHRRYAGRPGLSGKLERLVAGAALTVTANAHLEEWARAAGARRLHRMPTPVDLARYAPREADGGGFRVGWIGTPSSAAYLAEVAEPLRRLAETGPLTLVTVGAAPVGLPGVPEAFRPWSEATEADEISGFDVGIMPLPDTPFTRGKSGYKLLQYMAAARPVVASPVGENRVIVDPGVSGFLAGSPRDWVAALERLRADPGLRRTMGRAGRARVAADYALDALAPRLADALRAAGAGMPSA
ncbi:MAG TPA: glycosyltransferase [Azospirillaceae bacterium]|nr:glycosyltransferase [Azospirillaceae bacterium]